MANSVVVVAEIHIFLHGRWKSGGSAGVGMVVLGYQVVPMFACAKRQVGHAGTSHAAYMEALLFMFEKMDQQAFHVGRNIVIHLSDHSSMQFLTNSRALAKSETDLRARQEVVLQKKRYLEHHVTDFQFQIEWRHQVIAFWNDAVGYLARTALSQDLNLAWQSLGWVNFGHFTRQGVVGFLPTDADADPAQVVAIA